MTLSASYNISQNSKTAVPTLTHDSVTLWQGDAMQWQNHSFPPSSLGYVYEERPKTYKGASITERHQEILPGKLILGATWRYKFKHSKSWKKKFRHGLMPLWFTDLRNVTKEVTIHRPSNLTLLSSALIRGDLNAVTRSPFIQSLISCLFSDEV